MNCIKCGRETQGEQVFCLDCQKHMARYPVKEGTYVKLPQRREPPAHRRPVKRRALNPEDHIRALKLQVRELTLGLLFCLVLIAGMLYYITTHMASDHTKPGQNYSVAPASTTVQTSPDAA